MVKLSDEARLAKNQSIANTRTTTKHRRSQMITKTYQLKIIKNKTTKKAYEELGMAFKQAKYVRNHILSESLTTGKITEYKDKTVPVHTPASIEERKLDLLGSQVKQGIFDQIKHDIRALAERKKKGGKIGRLKFVREVNSLNLKQPGITYRFNEAYTRLKIQGLPTSYRVRGAHQFKNINNHELANAKLLKKPDGYYLAITTYLPHENAEEEASYKLAHIGIDFGVKTHLTLSTGEEVSVMIKETERLKRLQRKLQRQVKGSINHYKTRSLIAREYQKITNKKNELANQLISKLAQQAAIIVYQDDNIAAWKHKKSMAQGSRAVQHSILGRVKAKLSQHSRSVMVPRFAATTKTCVCGAVNQDIKLGDTIFKCSVCGYSAPRDVHAAQNMINFIPVEDGELKPVERKSIVLRAHAQRMLPPKKQETAKPKTAAEAAKSSV